MKYLKTYEMIDFQEDWEEKNELDEISDEIDRVDKMIDGDILIVFPNEMYNMMNDFLSDKIDDVDNLKKEYLHPDGKFYVWLMKRTSPRSGGYWELEVFSDGKPSIIYTWARYDKIIEIK